jgi:hypothetical protein
MGKLNIGRGLRGKATSLRIEGWVYRRDRTEVRAEEGRGKVREMGKLNILGGLRRRGTWSALLKLFCTISFLNFGGYFGRYHGTIDKQYNWSCY